MNEPAQPRLPGARCETCGGLFTPDGICRTCNPQPRCVDLGVTEAQPPVECKHEDVLVSIKGSAFRHPMSGEATCADCDAPMVVRPAAQWAAVGALVAEWESNVPEGHDAGVLGGMYAGCARQLRKAIGLERVTKGPANIIGRWPGDESDEEVNEALERLS